MSRMKDQASGNFAPSPVSFMDVGRFRLVASRIPGKVWLKDLETGEGGAFSSERFEAALLKFFSEEF